MYRFSIAEEIENNYNPTLEGSGRHDKLLPSDSFVFIYRVSKNGFHTLRCDQKVMKSDFLKINIS